MRYVVAQKREDRVNGRLTDQEIIDLLGFPHTALGLGGDGLVLIDTEVEPPTHPRLWIEPEMLYRLAERLAEGY